MNWIKAIFETFTQAVKTRDRLFVRIVPCPCGSLSPRLNKMWNGRWIVYCPSCKNRTIGDYVPRRRAKIVWREQNEIPRWEENIEDAQVWEEHMEMERDK